MGASLTDILTTAQNVVTAINGLGQTFLNVSGKKSAPALTSSTYVSSAAGRVCMVSIVDGGSASGTIYDATSATDTSRPIFTIIDTPGIIEVNIPVIYGILVVPGTGQTVSISYS